MLLYIGQMGLLRQRDFSLLLSSYALSSMGDYLALVTLTLKVQETTDSGWAVSGLLLAGLLPLVIFAPLAGLLVDRLETVRLLTLTALAQAVVTTGLAFADGLPQILVLVFLLGTGLAITQPALQVLVPRTVGEDRVTRANGLLEVARWATTPLGALLGAWLTSRFGSRITLLADAGTFLFVWLAVAAMRTRRIPQPRTADRPPERGEWRRGIAFLGRDRLLGLVVVVLGAMVVFASIDNVAEVFFAKDTLHAGRVGYGVLIAAWTFGIAVGAWICGRYVRPSALGQAILASSLAGGAAVMIAAGVAVFPLAVGMFVLGGMANGFELVAMRSLIHHRVPDQLRGRVFSSYYAIVNAGQIVALGLGGAVLEWLGARTTLFVAGAGAAVVAVLGTLAYLRLPREARATQETVTTAAAPDTPRA